MGLVSIAQEVRLETHECGECGILFAAPASFWKERRTTGAGWSCPNGHSRVFTETEAQKLQKKLDAEMQRAEFWRREAEQQRQQVTTTKGLLTKTQKKLARVEKGVCPQCNRSFANVARHMRSKHGIECNQPPKGAVLNSG